MNETTSENFPSFFESTNLDEKNYYLGHLHEALVWGNHDFFEGFLNNQKITYTEVSRLYEMSQKGELEFFDSHFFNSYMMEKLVPRRDPAAALFVKV